MALDSESGGSLEIKDMATALSPNVAEFILFDVCLMSSVEALYEIRNTCKYRRIKLYYEEVKRILRKWIRRRGGKTK